MFSNTVRSIEAWLDQHAAPVATSPGAAELVQRFREYLRFCRGRIDSGDMTLDEIIRRRKRIDNTFYTLWKSLRRR
jgi:hypothetical protein